MDKRKSRSTGFGKGQEFQSLETHKKSAQVTKQPRCSSNERGFQTKDLEHLRLAITKGTKQTDILFSFIDSGNHGQADHGGCRYKNDHAD